jgi:hypothetical protein
METKIYYKPPKQECFDDLKSACIRYFKTFDNDFGYADEKIKTLESLENVGGNFMTMVKMFHPLAWEVIAELLTLETRVHISARLEDGGHSLETDFFNIWGKNKAKELYGKIN